MNEEILIQVVDTHYTGIPSSLEGRIVSAFRTGGGYNFVNVVGDEYDEEYVGGYGICDDWIEDGMFRVLNQERFEPGDKVVVIGYARKTYWYAERVGEEFILDRDVGNGA